MWEREHVVQSCKNDKKPGIGIIQKEYENNFKNIYFFMKENSINVKIKF